MQPQDWQALVGLGGVAVVSGLIEMVKRVFALADTQWTRVLPLVAIILGVAWNWLIAPLAAASGLEWRIVVVYGLLSGLGAIGLYASAAKPGQA